MNKITKKWKVSGLLEGVDKDQVDDLAKLLDETAKELLSKRASKKSKSYESKELMLECVCSYLIPAVRIIFLELSHLEARPSASWLVKDALNFFVKHKNVYQALMESSCIAMDGEVEFTNIYTNDVIKRLK